MQRIRRGQRRVGGCFLFSNLNEALRAQHSFIYKRMRYIRRKTWWILHFCCASCFIFPDLVINNVGSAELPRSDWNFIPISRLSTVGILQIGYRFHINVNFKHSSSNGATGSVPAFDRKLEKKIPIGINRRWSPMISCFQCLNESALISNESPTFQFKYIAASVQLMLTFIQSVHKLNRDEWVRVWNAVGLVCWYSISLLDLWRYSVGCSFYTWFPVLLLLHLLLFNLFCFGRGYHMTELIHSRHWHDTGQLSIRLLINL